MGITQIQKIVKWLQGQGVTYFHTSIIALALTFGVFYINTVKEQNAKLDQFMEVTNKQIEIIKDSQQEQVQSLVDLNGMLISDKIEMMRLEFADCETLEDARARINFWIENKWTAQIASAKLVCTYAQKDLKEALFPPETADIICKAVR